MENEHENMQDTPGQPASPADRSETPARRRDKGRIPWPLWLGLPCFTLAVLWLSPLLGRQTWDLLIPNEIGFLEIGTVALLVPAVALSLAVSLRRGKIPTGFRALMVLVALAALYFAGEECSWGQTYLRWKTPEAWSRVNKQHETNLHNLKFKGSNLLNNVPRQGMLLACVVGGIALPLVRLRPSWDRRLQGFWGWAVPPLTIVPASLLAVLSTAPEKLYNITLKRAGMEWARDGYAYMALIDPAGELKEYCYGLVILLYAVAAYTRARTLRKSAEGGPGI